jgi:hypothetical protein
MMQRLRKNNALKAGVGGKLDAITDGLTLGRNVGDDILRQVWMW